MIRPWIGVLSVVVGLAALPGVALAQDAAPTITITAPAEGATYSQGQAVIALYTCDDDVRVASCSGTLANGALLDTSVAGSTHTFLVIAHDNAGNTASEYRHYTIGGGGGTAPAVLSLTLGTPTPFAPFTPGIDRSYTTTVQSTIISTAANALLTVADMSTTATGRLVNGTYSLTQPLQASGASVAPVATPGPLTPVGTSAAPSTLLSYGGPVSSDPVTLTFSQAIAQVEPLRTGPYSKLLTFTLSTTAP